MSAADSVRTFEVRHVQLARALFAALAAIMITFSPDHSAAVGLSVFSGFAIATGLVLLLAVWLVYPAGRRAPTVLMGIVTILAGMVGGLIGLRTTAMFFVLVIAWAAITGIIELVSGIRGRRATTPTFGDPRPADPHARDAITVGILSLILAVAVAVVPAGYSLDYVIADAGRSFTLTGITIAVGIFGGYAAIIAVFLGIAGFSPRRTEQLDAVVRPAETTAGEPS